MDFEKALNAFEASARQGLPKKPELTEVLARVESFDLTGLSNSMVPALRKTFKGFRSSLPLRSVCFSFSDGGGSSDGKADTTATASCSSKGAVLTAIDGDSMGATDMDSDCGGIPLGRMPSLVRAARDASDGNAAGRVVLAHVARAVRDALRRATTSQEFKALTKAARVTFFISEHDLGDLACFEWEGAASPNTALAQLAKACVAQPHGLIVCGPARAEQAHDAAAMAELARLTGYPLWCEATSQLRFQPTALGQCDGLPAVLEDSKFVSQHRPKVILQFGLPAAKAWARFAARADGHRFVVAPYKLMRGHPEDPETKGRKAVVASISEVVAAVSGVASGEPPRGPDWANEWRARNEAAWADTKRAGGALTEARLLRTVVAGMPRGGQLSFDQAFPVDEVCRASTGDFTVHTQVMGAMQYQVFKAAIREAATGRPTLVLMGVPFLKELEAGLNYDSGLRVPCPSPALPIVLVIKKATEFALLSRLTRFLGGATHLQLPKRPVTTVAAFNTALGKAREGTGLNVMVALVAPAARPKS